MPEERKVTIDDAVDTIVLGEFYDPVSNTRKPLVARMEGDGTIRLHALQIAVDADSREVNFLAESNRAVGVSLYGQDPDDVTVGLRTNLKKQLQVQIVGLSTAMLLSMVLLELRLTNLHLGKISGLTEATTDDVEGND